MPLRKLLSITLDNNSRMTAPSSLLSTWDICAVNDLGTVQKALDNFSYPVGLLLFTPDKAIDFEALEVMLDTHTATQWVGVFPVDEVKQSAYRNLVKVNRFRNDRLDRLNTLPLTVSALRARKDGLELLANHFLKVFSSDKNPCLTGFSVRTLRALTAHDWPSNVRELINRIRRAMVLANRRVFLLHRKEVQSETYSHTLKNVQENRFLMFNSLEV